MDIKDNYIKNLNNLSHLPEDDSSRLIRAAGIISDYIKKKYDLDLTVVGGLSVEVYSGGGYTTQDIDFVGVNHEKIMEGLVNLGFRRIGKDSVHDKLNIYVEVPSSVLEGSQERVINIETQDHYRLAIIGIDDILIDRLRALVQWDEKMQEEWIFLLLKNHFDEIDYSYIQDKLTDEENERFKQFLDLLKEENEYERMQFEFTLELDKRNVPYSVVDADEINIIAIPSKKDSYYGLSLSPIVMGYIYEEDNNGDETFYAIKADNLEFKELKRWLLSLPEDEIIKKEELVKALECIIN